MYGNSVHYRVPALTRQGNRSPAAACGVEAVELLFLDTVLRLLNWFLFKLEPRLLSS